MKDNPKIFEANEAIIMYTLMLKLLYTKQLPFVPVSSTHAWSMMYPNITGPGIDPINLLRHKDYNQL